MKQTLMFFNINLTCPVHYTSVSNHESKSCCNLCCKVLQYWSLKYGNDQLKDVDACDETEVMEGEFLNFGCQK